MKVPERLKPLVEDGLIDEILSQLMSGKEAQVYVVRCGTEIRCAKVYKAANQRSFKQAAQYQEGRKVKNSRQARAMGKRSRYGQRESEQAWVSAEIDALYCLAAAGARVPMPYGFVDGVLLMELVTDGDGIAAPRLNDQIKGTEAFMGLMLPSPFDKTRLILFKFIHFLNNCSNSSCNASLVASASAEDPEEASPKSVSSSR